MSGFYCQVCEIEHDGEPCPPIPRCDLCHTPCKPADLTKYYARPFDPTIQAPLSICLQCWKREPPSAELLALRG